MNYSSIERAITGAADGPYPADIERTANRQFVRAKLEASISAAAGAIAAMAEFLRSGLDIAIDNFEAWEEGEHEPLGDEVTGALADALRLSIEAQGLIEPHQRMFSAIERYQQSED